MPVATFASSRAIALPNAEGVHWLLGWSVAEVSNGGYSARVRIYDGSSASGTLLASIHLDANGSVRDGPFPEGQIPVTSGSIYVQLSSPTGDTATAEGSIWYA